MLSPADEYLVRQQEVLVQSVLLHSHLLTWEEKTADIGSVVREALQELIVLVWFWLGWGVRKLAGDQA